MKKRQAEKRAAIAAGGIVHPEHGTVFPAGRRMVFTLRRRSGAKGKGSLVTRVGVGLAETPDVAQALVDHYVATPESILSTDLGNAFYKVGKEFQLHLQVNHSETLVGPEGQHVNNSEGFTARQYRSEKGIYQDGEWASVCEGKSSSRRNEGCDLPKAGEPLSWNVVFDGRELGPVETRGWRNSDYYSFTGALTIATSPVPSVKDTPASFAAWWGQPAHRPLVAVNGLVAHEAHSFWQHEKVRAQDAGLAWPFFKAKVPTIPNCQFSDEGVALGKARPAVFADMTVFDRVRLANGGVLLGIHAKGAEECAEDSGFASDLWVVLPARGKPFALGDFDGAGWAHSLNLVDVGDYAGDGASGQAVFYYSGYNEDGYILYYDNFRKHVDFTWGYH